MVHVDEGNDAAALLGRGERLKQKRAHPDVFWAERFADAATRQAADTQQLIEHVDTRRQRVNLRLR
jgi:hypothetical protein